MDTTLHIQTVDSQLSIELDYAYKAEARIHELAFVNKTTAPELCAAFNSAYARLAETFGMLLYKLGQAEIAVKRRKAVLTLDVIPDKMTEKKLGKGNEDIREAFYYLDDDYVKAKDALASIEAAKELIYIKMNALRMAFEATKAVLKDTGFTGEAKGGVSAIPETAPMVTPGWVPVVEQTRTDSPPPGYSPVVAQSDGNYKGWGVKPKY